MPLTKIQQEDSRWYHDVKLPELLLDPALKWKYVVVHGRSIISSHAEFSDAHAAAVKEFQPGEFLVQQVADPSERVNGFNYHNIILPALAKAQNVAIHTHIESGTEPGHHSLAAFGFNLQVIVAAHGSSDQHIALAQLDTGASVSVIAEDLARRMGLPADGAERHTTGGGAVTMSMYNIDLRFPETKLSPFINLRVGSSLHPHHPGDLGNQKNIGLLLGRDILSKWSVVWNGPTSTVIISD